MRGKANKGESITTKEKLLRGSLNRILQLCAMFSPGAETLRVLLHRARGVSIGKNVWISFNVVLETSYPYLITIEDGCFIGVGVIVIAHFKDSRCGVRIGENAFIGPGAIILPDVEIGNGSVVTAGSVVTNSVPAMTVVQGNPAVPVAKCGVPLRPDTPPKEFSRHLRPVTAHVPKPRERPEQSAESADRSSERNSGYGTDCSLHR